MGDFWRCLSPKEKSFNSRKCSKKVHELPILQEWSYLERLSVNKIIFLTVNFYRFSVQTPKLLLIVAFLLVVLWMFQRVCYGRRCEMGRKLWQKNFKYLTRTLLVGLQNLQSERLSTSDYKQIKECIFFMLMGMFICKRG